MRRALALAVAAAFACAGLLPSVASAASLGGLRDERYCEIFVVRGALPAVEVTVWNTIGLGRCPAAWWNAFDAADLTAELGSTAVVFNGPRHFLMDSVSAEPGAVRSFHGKRMRKVASIPISSAADLSQVPYTDRTIARDNTWRWRRGRTVFELVAPGGDTYVMQSYAQIVDPKLTIGKLRGLGARLDLPPGWRYRTRRLRRELALDANGTVTIIQDQLQNTYQLATTVQRRAHPARHALSLTGRTRTVPPATAGTIEDHGTVMGAPFGRGSIVLVGKLAGGRLEGSFRLLYRHGSITGSVSMPYTISAGRISFDGTGRLTGGTGAYRGISSGALEIRATNTLDGQSGRLSVAGVARY